MIDATASEAAAARERLARYGRLLLPEVHAKLRQAATDQARERLTALRYRLVARDALVLDWADGLERLAATAAETRHQAVQELARRAGSGEEALLLELFSDPDPLVREISLGALHAIAGSNATAALVGLLADPDPNVRAAVLKQMAEKPSAGLVTKIAGYIATETDVDLVVHGVRALRAAKAKTAVEPLLKLLEHASWRVRAEAAESLHEIATNASSLGSERDNVRADVYAAFIRLLEDPDGFVVSRALKGLKGADTVAAVEPMVAAANKHPELAAEAVRTLNGGSSMRRASIPHLRKFASHSMEEVRAAAVTALCAVDNDVEKDLRTALHDQASIVRRAGAEAFTQILGRQRGAPPDFDKWLMEFRAGKHRPRWTTNLVKDLTPLLGADAREERLAAAVPLVALGREDKTLPVLLDVARSQPDLLGKVSAAATWLAWSKREAFFKNVLELNPAPDELAEAVQAFQSVRDERALAIFWEMTAREEMSDKLASELAEAVVFTATGLTSYSNEFKSDSERKAAAKLANERVQSGSDLQRTIAMVLLAKVSLDDAATTARDIIAQTGISPRLKEDAFRIFLLCASKTDGRKEAIAAIDGADPIARNLAVSYLATGAGRLAYLRGQSLYVHVQNPSLLQGTSAGSGQPFIPDAPPGLKADTLLSLMRSADPDIAAQAGYLLTLLQRPEGLAPLVAYWREHGKSEDVWRTLVCQAVVALGDDRNVSILAEIYRGLLEAREPYHYQIKEFYWTIRGLDGPNALALRKRIRQDVGMEHLR
jgi:HEAT repeat protein